MLQKQDNDVLWTPSLKELNIIIKPIFFHKTFKKTEKKHYVLFKYVPIQDH